MSWKWGVQRLPDGTYVDRPRPSRWFLVLHGALIPSTPFWVIWANSLIPGAILELSLMGLALGLVASLNVWNASQIEYRITHERLTAKAPFARRSVERWRVGGVRLVRFEGSTHALTNRWTNILIIEQGGKLFGRLRLSPTSPDEFAAELQKRPFGAAQVAGGPGRP